MRRPPGRCRSTGSSDGRGASTRGSRNGSPPTGTCGRAGSSSRPGSEYGAHFRAYPRNPENSHARYLVQAVPVDHVATWPGIAGGVRVAQGVRKEFLLAGVDAAAGVEFLSLERIRP